MTRILQCIVTVLLYLGLTKCSEIITEQDDTVTVLQQQVKDLTNMVLDLKEEMDTRLLKKDADIEALRREIAYMNHTKQCVAQEEEFISFTAYSTTERTYGVGDTVMFDQIVLNYGGYYDTTTSTFICPVSGLYLFSMALQRYPNDYIWVDMVKNGEQLVAVNISGDDDGNGHGSNTVIVLCQADDEVWVNSRSANNRIVGSATTHFTTFTGSLLRLNP